jgi:Zn-dependent protease
MIAVLVSLTIHEFSHAFIAYKLGDETAKNEGRLSLNPIKHLDTVGTILFLLIGVGYGKAVPVNPINFKDPKKGQILVSLAGPLSNIILAFIVQNLITISGYNNVFLTILVEINILLAAFNLIPIPPLDGSSILNQIFKPQTYYKYRKFFEDNMGYLILFIYLDTTILGKYGYSIFINLIQIITMLIKAIIFI